MRAMKWFLGLLPLVIVAVIVYIERWNIEQWLEKFAADRIEADLHGTGGGGDGPGGGGSPSVVKTFAKGVGKRVLAAEIGRL